MTTRGAVIMLGPWGDSPGERLMAAAHQASAADLLERLNGAGIDEIVVAAPETSLLPVRLPPNARIDLDPPHVPFHFGNRLAGLIESSGWDTALYFGGGSAPLLDAAAVSAIIAALDSPPVVVTNNLHSSDWAGIAPARLALPFLRKLNRDNSLAWELHEVARFRSQVMDKLSPALRMDLDTPVDAAILAWHPRTPAHLRFVLSAYAPLLEHIPVRRFLDTLLTDGKTVALLGRVSPGAWSALNKSARVWTRVIAEERGMVASERAARGEVRSVLRPWLESRGPAGFFADLAGMTDAAAFDTRVLFAALNLNPGTAERFAADLLMPDQIRDWRLRAFTEAAAQAPLPLLMGGHSVVAGGFHALLECLSAL